MGLVPDVSSAPVPDVPVPPALSAPDLSASGVLVSGADGAPELPWYEAEVGQLSTGQPWPGSDGLGPGAPQAVPPGEVLPDGFVPGDLSPYGVPPAPTWPAQPDQPVPAAQGLPEAVPTTDGLLPGSGPLPAGPPSVPGQYPVGPLDRFPAGQEPYPGTAGPYSPTPRPTSRPAQDPWAEPDEGRGRKVLWLVVAGAVALVVVAVGGFFVWDKVSGDGGVQAAADRQAAAEAAVTSYLEAIAQGDAATALEQLAEEPDSTWLLTDDVLAASNEAAALTGIKVRAGEATGGAVAVKASYRLGDTDVDQTFTVTERDGTGSTAWAVVDGTATVDLSVATGALPLAVNGQAVTSTSAVVLFPGSYTLTVAGDPGAYITLGTATFQVTGSDDVKTPTIAATLTDDGVAAFRQAVRASVEACVASPNLESGCPGSGLDVPASMSDGTVTTEGTVVRTLSAELSAELDALVPRLSGTNPARAYTVAPDGLVNIAITGTRNGQAVAGDVRNALTEQPGFQLGTPEVDMTDPALPVTWSGR